MSTIDCNVERHISFGQSSSSKNGISIFIFRLFHLCRCCCRHRLGFLQKNRFSCNDKHKMMYISFGDIAQLNSIRMYVFVFSSGFRFTFFSLPAKCSKAKWKSKMGKNRMEKEKMHEAKGAFVERWCWRHWYGLRRQHTPVCVLTEPSQCEDVIMLYILCLLIVCNRDDTQRKVFDHRTLNVISDCKMIKLNEGNTRRKRRNEVEQTIFGLSFLSNELSIDR